jgi:23S rRNA (adenine2030-N6)-methyltransferase
MNYRHAYHAGNFADVLKHAVLALAVEHLKRKPAPFRVVDTHAGTGCYALDSGPAEKTGEWRRGIGRIFGPDAPAVPETARRLLAPYLSVVASLNPPGRLERYPGSPLVAKKLLRPGDRLIVNELHPEDAAELSRLFKRDRQTTVLRLDAWIALKSLLPPRERRGVILVDPPFEEPEELRRLEQGLGEGVKRFPTGIYLLWYPIKDPKPIEGFLERLAKAAYGPILDVRLLIRRPSRPDVLNGCGLVILNPPFRLDEALRDLLPILADRLSEGPGAGHRLRTLS